MQRTSGKLREVAVLAERLGCTPSQLAIAWSLKNEHVHSVLIGAISVQQLYEHLQALQVSGWPHWFWLIRPADGFRLAEQAAGRGGGNRRFRIDFLRRTFPAAVIVHFPGHAAETKAEWPAQAQPKASGLDPGTWMDRCSITRSNKSSVPAPASSDYP